MKAKKLDDPDFLVDCLREGNLTIQKGSAAEGPFISVEYEESEVVRLPLEAVPVGLPLPCPLYARVDKKFVMFRRQGDKISLRRIMALQEREVAHVYIHRKFWEYFLDELGKQSLSENQPPEQRVSYIRNVLTAYGEMLQEKTKQDKKQLFERIQQVSYALAKEIYDDQRIGLKSLYRNVTPATYFINHSVNTAVFSALIAKSIGSSLEDVQLITYGAVVHDIGNMFIPKEILFKPGKLSPEEYEIVKTHTTQGAELLQTLGSPPLVVTIALQHHERVSGFGYPKGLRGEQIHPFSKIVAISDVFDAILSHRPHRKGEKAEDAIRLMTGEEGLFDPKFLHTMFGKLK